ncbi:MAG: M56 family metallopeptidase [Acidobacteriota bacterium]
MTLLMGLALRTSVILAAGLLLSACLRRRSAALRHLVLAAAFAAAALVGPLGLILPEWTVTLPARNAGATTTADALVRSGGMADSARAHQAATPRVVEPPGPGFAGLLARWSVRSAVAVWLAGVLAVAFPLVVGLLRVGRAAARASRVDDPRWLHALETIAHRYGLSCRIAVARTESPDLVATWGIVRPRVLLPHHARDWPMDRVHIVLCHELAHIRRHDWVVQLGGEVVLAVLWFNPLAWMTCRRLRLEGERACDDEVLALGVGGREYAGHLIELARLCRRSGLAWTSAMPMAHPRTLERRITAMLNPRLDRQVPSRRAMTALAAALLLVTLPAAALTARLAAPEALSGTVYDPTGGVLPGVEVVLEDEYQNRSAATTDASGRFEFPAVAPGAYVMHVSLPGFRTLRQRVQLRDAGDWDRAIMLQVGELAETVTVSESRLATPSPYVGGAAAARVRVGGNIRPPRKEVDVKPVYPPAMREAGLSGVVPVEAIIGLDGTVSSVRVVSAQVHPDFAIAAVDAVRQWRFTPTLLNREPVEVVMRVTVRFDLKD